MKNKVGRWIPGKDGHWHCEFCDEWAIKRVENGKVLQALTPYCPWCGANLTGKELDDGQENGS